MKDHEFLKRLLQSVETNQKTLEYYVTQIQPLRNFLDISAFLHHTITSKHELNSLMIYEGARYKELIQMIGSTLAPASVDGLTKNLGRSEQTYPVIRNAQRQFGTVDPNKFLTDASYYNLDTASLKIFGEEFGSTAQQEMAMKDNLAEAKLQWDLSKKSVKETQEKLKLYQKMISKLKKKKNEIFTSILTYVFKDLIKNQKIVVANDRRRLTTMSIQDLKRFDLDSIRKSMEFSNRTQISHDLLSVTRDKLNEHFDRNALIVQKNEIMSMIKWLQQKIKMLKLEERFNTMAIKLGQDIDEHHRKDKKRHAKRHGSPDDHKESPKLEEKDKQEDDGPGEDASKYHCWRDEPRVSQLNVQKAGPPSSARGSPRSGANSARKMPRPTSKRATPAKSPTRSSAASLARPSAKNPARSAARSPARPVEHSWNKPERAYQRPKHVVGKFGSTVPISDAYQKKVEEGKIKVGDDANDQAWQPQAE